MLRTSVLVALALAVGAAGCQARHGPPRVKKLPKRDDTPALRGGGAARSPRNANYRIEARLDGARHTITASETLTWTNTGSSAVSDLPLHLYLNAFKNEQSLFMRSSHGEMRGAEASDTGWGWISVDQLTIGGVDLADKLTYPHLPDETVAIVPLAQAVEPGSTVEVQMKFTAQLPEVFARTGYKGDFHLVGQWFPKIGVRVGPPGAERWECQPHHAFTEFFADFGSYDVALTVPATYVIAATGVLVSATEAPGQTRTFTYHAEDVHDFVWMADPYMMTDATGKTPFVAKAKVEDGEVEVRVYARKEQAEFAKRHLQAAVGAVERFSAYFMPYPWPILTVIDPPVDASGAAGMEYPTLVTTAGDSVFSRPGMRLPEYTTVHEVGHNWFQGMLASNEPEEAWLDEGLNEWADAIVMRDIYGPRGNAADWRGWQADISALRKAITEDPSQLPVPIATAAYAFVDFDAGSIATYISTARARDARGASRQREADGRDEGLREELRVQASDRARSVRDAGARARPGPELVHRPGVPAGRWQRAQGPHQRVSERARCARRVQRRSGGRPHQGGDRSDGQRGPPSLRFWLLRRSQANHNNRNRSAQHRHLRLRDRDREHGRHPRARRDRARVRRWLDPARALG